MNVCILTPTIDGKVEVTYLMSLIGTVNAFSKKKIGMTFNLLSGESLITRARNKMIAQILQINSQCSAKNKITHALFIDSDIGWRADQVEKLINHDKLIVGGIYPKKTYKLERLNQLDAILGSHKNIRNAKIPLSDFIVSNLLEHNINLLDGNDINVSSSGLLQVKHIPTGFMLINMSVFDVLIDKFGASHKCFLNGKEPELEAFHYRFFDTGVDENNYYLSEDWYFSELCHKAGINVYADIGINLTHTGRHDFNGRLLSEFEYNDGGLTSKFK